MRRVLNLLLWAGGLGTRLRPLTFEDLGNRVVACYPKGVLPLAGLPLLCRVLESVLDGVAAAGWSVGRLLVSTTPEAQHRVVAAVAQSRSFEATEVDFIVGPYTAPGDRFLRALSRTYPTLSCHDDTLVTAESVATMVRAFSLTHQTVIAVSPEPSDGSVPFAIKQNIYTIDLTDTGDSHVFHAPLRIYAPGILNLAADVVGDVEQEQAEEFREFKLSRYLLKHALASPVLIRGLLNVNSPNDYLRALRFLVGDGYYVAPNADCHPASSLVTVAIEEGCRIGNISAENAILFPEAVVGDGCVLQRCIIGHGTHILPTTYIQGSEEAPVVIGNFKTIRRNTKC